MVARDELVDRLNDEIMILEKHLKKTRLSIMNKMKMNIKLWDKTVFAVFNNKKLKSELEKWVIENDCELCWGVPRTPDIIAIPYFVSVIDRNVLGEESWEMYLRYHDNDEDDPEYWQTEVCIIVDDRKDMELPGYDQVLCFDLRYEESIRWVINAVDMAKKLANTKKVPTKYLTPESVE